MRIEKIKPGMVLWDVHSHRMGNTTMRTLGCWQVVVESVDEQTQTIVASWNGNPSQRMYRNQWAALKKNKPELIRCPLGNYRRKTRDEIKSEKTVAR